nr:arabinosyltransferase domain-containing protein [Corynebacterium endometrii]
MVAGLVGFLMFVATPLLPVNQTQASLSWPQNESLNSVNAPLISVAPESIQATIPLEAADYLNEGQTLLYGTVPPESEEATNRGMFVRTGDFGLTVTSLDEVVLSLSAEEASELPADAALSLTMTGDGTTVSAGRFEETIEEDLRPQVTGVYTEIENTPEALAALSSAGLDVDVEINSRFTSSPTPLKLAAMWIGLAMVLVSLFCLWRIDALDGQKRGFMPPSWKQVRPLDGVVAAILVFWHIFGSNTSDDGFIFTMGRVSENADYMANYYRWYGVPESPFGSPYYDLIALLAQINTASIFMRLPALIAGLLVWFVLSREILPRFGANIDGRRVAHWTAAFMFLAFWLPYNNGTRPEPIVALGVMLTWASFERSIATRRLLPAAVGTIIATLTLGLGPTGLFAVGVFLVCLPRLFKFMSERVASMGGGALGWLTMVAPFLACGTAILVAVFGDQTLATVLESTRVRTEVGPALPWHSEYVRYTTLFEQSVDGSMTRRFAMFTMLFCLVLILFAYVKDRRIPSVPAGPTRRLLLIIALSMFFLLFTPTKWTHHFGIYAGVAGVVAALGAVVLSQIALKSPRARTFAVGSVVLLMAISLAGWNAWWYVSSFGIPWWDRAPQFKGIEFSTVVLVIGLVIMGVGVVQSMLHSVRLDRAREAGHEADFRADEARKVSRWAGIVSAPIALACIVMVSVSMASFAKAYVSQGEAFSIGRGNLASLGGDRCGLASHALIEKNTNAAFLTPIEGSLADSLVNEEERFSGFDPNWIPESIEPENMNSASVGAIATQTEDSSDTAPADPSQGAANDGTTLTEEQQEQQDRESASEGGTRETKGANGSTIQLPFNLDYTKVPVLGSYNEAQQGTAQVTTQWFELPEATETTPLLTMSVAGRIYHHDVNGVEQEGLDLVLEYGTRDGQSVTNVGELEMSDVGATPQWRNLRIALEDIPAEADVVRVSATDDSLDEDDWVAFTPPRVPELQPLGERFTLETPALLDWSVALQFPCQRTFDHYAGVTEIPEYRVSPDAPGKSTLTDFQSFSGGGAMATAEAVNYSYEIPSYLANDWARDYGSIEKYELRTNSLGEAPVEADIQHEVITRSGLWKDSEMKIRPEGSE